MESAVMKIDNYNKKPNCSIFEVEAFIDSSHWSIAYVVGALVWLLIPAFIGLGYFAFVFLSRFIKLFIKKKDTPPEKSKNVFLKSFLLFLIKEVTYSTMDDEKRGLLTSAIHNLKTVYQLSSEECANANFVDLLAHISKELFKQTTRDKATEHNHNGNTAFKNQEYMTAVREYTKAIKLNPKNPSYYCNRAEALNNLCLLPSALADCKRALTLKPDCARAYNRMGVVYISLQNWSQAIRFCQYSLKFDPMNFQYKTNLRIAEQGYLRAFDNGQTVNQHSPIQGMEFVNRLCYYHFGSRSRRETSENYRNPRPFIRSPVSPDPVDTEEDFDVDPNGPFFVD